MWRKRTIHGGDSPNTKSKKAKHTMQLKTTRPIQDRQDYHSCGKPKFDTVSRPKASIETERPCLLKPQSGNQAETNLKLKSPDDTGGPNQQDYQTGRASQDSPSNLDHFRFSEHKEEYKEKPKGRLMQMEKKKKEKNKSPMRSEKPSKLDTVLR